VAWHHKPGDGHERQKEDTRDHDWFAAVPVGEPAPEVAGHQPAQQDAGVQPDDVLGAEPHLLFHEQRDEGDQRYRCQCHQANANQIGEEVGIACGSDHLPVGALLVRISPGWRTAGDFERGPDGDDTQKHANGDQDHEPAGWWILAEDVAGGQRRQEGSQTGQGVLDGRVLAPQGVRHLLLQPGIVGSEAHGAREAKDADSDDDESQDSILAEPG
jgi:hypothetical protein